MYFGITHSKLDTHLRTNFFNLLYSMNFDNLLKKMKLNPFR